MRVLGGASYQWRYLIYMLSSINHTPSPTNCVSSPVNTAMTKCHNLARLGFMGIEKGKRKTVRVEILMA